MMGVAVGEISSTGGRTGASSWDGLVTTADAQAEAEAANKMTRPTVQKMSRGLKESRVFIMIFDILSSARLTKYYESLK